MIMSNELNELLADIMPTQLCVNIQHKTASTQQLLDSTLQTNQAMGRKLITKEIDTHKGDDLSIKERVKELLNQDFVIVPQMHGDKSLCCIEYEDEFDAVHAEPAHIEYKEVELNIKQLICDMQEQIANLESDNKELEDAIEALTNKLGDNCCACPCDKKDDVCGVHAPKLLAAQRRISKLEEALNKIIYAHNRCRCSPEIECSMMTGCLGDLLHKEICEAKEALEGK